MQAMSRAFYLRRITSVEAKAPALLLLLAMFAFPAFASERMTVQQLAQALTDLHGMADRETAQRLTVFELTERLTRQRFEQMKAALPGDKSRQALLALADASAFLDLPAADTLHDPAPDSATQGQIVSRAADFVVATVSRMPDFFASRTTTRFQDSGLAEAANSGSFISSNGGFLLKDINTDTVTFRNGREVAEAATKKKSGSSVRVSSGLANWGIFGPLLGVVMADVMKGRIGWGHWEQGPQGKLAVFRYAVPKDRSNYTVRYCCFRSEEGEMSEFEAVPSYYGEIAIDPANGSVFRLVLKTNLQPKAAELADELPIERLDVLVEYGPVEIGGKTCICPIESTTISRAEAIEFHGYTFYVNKKGKPDANGDKKAHAEALTLPKVTAINDVVFDNYHQFRGEMRILPADNADQDGSTPAPGATTPSKSPPIHLLP
jgi:hypothetical protein